MTHAQDVFGKVARTFPCFSLLLQEAYSPLRSILLLSRTIKNVSFYDSCTSTTVVLFVLKREGFVPFWRFDSIKQILVAVVCQFCGDLCSEGRCQLYVWLFQPSF